MNAVTMEVTLQPLPFLAPHVADFHIFSNEEISDTYERKQRHIRHKIWSHRIKYVNLSSKQYALKLC